MPWKPHSYQPGRQEYVQAWWSDVLEFPLAVIDGIAVSYAIACELLVDWARRRIR